MLFYKFRLSQFYNFICLKYGIRKYIFKNIELSKNGKNYFLIINRFIHKGVNFL